MSERAENDHEHQSKSLHKTDNNWCTRIVDQLEQSDLPDRLKLIRRLKNCAQYRQHGLNSGKKRNYCNLRYLCKACADMHANSIAMEYATKILSLMIEFELYPLFMTLRPKAGIDLVQQLIQLDQILKKIQDQRKNHFYKGKRFTEFCRFQYSLVMLEVIRTTDNQLWFPHVHSIVLNPSSNALFNLPVLANEWRKISESEVPPDVETVKAADLFRNNFRSQNLTLQTQGTIFRNLKKMIEYPFKMVHKDQSPLLCPSDQIAVHSAMRRRQRIREWTTPKNYLQTHINKL